MKNVKIITAWGILDLLALAWYMGWRSIDGQIPFYHDISKAVETSSSFGCRAFLIVPIIPIVIYVSFVFSGGQVLH